MYVLHGMVVVLTGNVVESVSVRLVVTAIGSIRILSLLIRLKVLTGRIRGNSVAKNICQERSVSVFIQLPSKFVPVGVA